MPTSTVTTRAIALAIVGVVLTARLGQAATQPTLDPGHCADAREAQRRTWAAREPVREQPATTEGARVRHWPTATLGTWVIEVAGTDRAELTVVTANEVVRIGFDERCVPATRREPRSAAEAPRFTDRDLDDRTKGASRGVVYVWSPHMPLSVDTIGPLTTAAKAHGLAVDLVLDPAADRTFATRIATERGLPDAALRVADSAELLFREALIHAPSVLVYAGGTIVGSVYPGGHTVEEYRAYFSRVLAQRR